MGEEETEVYKYISRNEEDKHQLVDDYKGQWNQVSFNANNTRKESSLLLDLIHKTTKQDIDTLKAIEKETSGGEFYYEELTHVLDKLSEQEVASTELLEKFHVNDLPPIAVVDSPIPKNRSNIYDFFFFDTSLYMPSNIDPED